MKTLIFLLKKKKKILPYHLPVAESVVLIVFVRKENKLKNKITEAVPTYILVPKLLIKLLQL